MKYKIRDFMNSKPDLFTPHTKEFYLKELQENSIFLYKIPGFIDLLRDKFEFHSSLSRIKIIMLLN